MVGGLIVGVLEQFGAGLISSKYKDAVAFVVILLTLFVMPHGLFGRVADREGVTMAGICERRRSLVALLALLIAVAPVLFPSNFYYEIGASIFITALAVVGLNLLMGYAGQVSLGHAGFFGIGAYAVAIGPTHFGIPSLLSLVAGLALVARHRLAGRPPDPAAQGPLPRRRHARLRLPGQPWCSPTRRAGPAGRTA